jgi:hypothetical protein
MIFYGIDPGFTGAIAVYAPNTGFFDVFDMPTMLNSKGKVELNHFERRCTRYCKQRLPELQTFVADGVRHSPRQKVRNTQRAVHR